MANLKFVSLLMLASITVTQPAIASEAPIQIAKAAQKQSVYRIKSKQYVGSDDWMMVMNAMDFTMMNDQSAFQRLYESGLVFSLKPGKKVTIVERKPYRGDVNVVKIKEVDTGKTYWTVDFALK